MATFDTSIEIYLLRRRLTGLRARHPDTIRRRFVSTRGRLTITPDGITAHLNNRTYSPVLRTSPQSPFPGGTDAPLTLENGQPIPR